MNFKSQVSGSYIVEVNVHSYHNPSGRCAECQDGPEPGCCDETFVRPLDQACPNTSLCDPIMLALYAPPIRGTSGFVSTGDAAMTVAIPESFRVNANSIDFDSDQVADFNHVIEREEPWNVRQ